jgi:hypothetical protein
MVDNREKVGVNTVVKWEWEIFSTYMISRVEVPPIHYCRAGAIRSDATFMRQSGGKSERR